MNRCIIGELIKRKPLFPGKSHANQVQLILEVKGYRTPADLGVALTTEASSFLDRRCRYNGQSLSSFIPQASPAAIELLSGLLQLNPALRPTAAEALAKPYLADAQTLADYSNPSNQPRQIDESFFDFERNEYSIEELRDMIRDEVKSYKIRPTSSGSVRTGITPAKVSSPKANGVKAPAPEKNPDVTIVERQTSGDRAERQMSAGIERSSGPYSQAPTAVRGRQMSSSNLGPSDDRVDFNKRELDDENEQNFRELAGEHNITSTTAEVANSGAEARLRSGSLPRQESGSRKSSSRKAPPTPSPGKMQSIAKQERKQKRIFYLQSMQRKNEEDGGARGTDELANTSGDIRRISSNSTSNIRAGGIGYIPDSTSGKYRALAPNNAAIPPLPVEIANSATATDNGDLSQLFNQFQSSSFSARERRETLPTDNHMIKYSGRQLATAPDLNKAHNSRFPSLRGSGKQQPPGRL